MIFTSRGEHLTLRGWSEGQSGGSELSEGWLLLYVVQWTYAAGLHILTAGSAEPGIWTLAWPQVLWGPLLPTLWRSRMTRLLTSLALSPLAFWGCFPVLGWDPTPPWVPLSSHPHFQLSPWKMVGGCMQNYVWFRLRRVLTSHPCWHARAETWLVVPHPWYRHASLVALPSWVSPLPGLSLSRVEFIYTSLCFQKSE